MTLVYLDTETTGLDPNLHEVWEVAWAVDDGPIISGSVWHRLENFDPKALEINGYHERIDVIEPVDGDDLYKALHGATLVGANPAFDAAFLRARWGEAPWRYRMLDVEAYAMPLLGYSEPKGLATIAADLGVEAPDHTAAADVHTLRECHRRLRQAYARQVWA